MWWILMISSSPTALAGRPSRTTKQCARFIGGRITVSMPMVEATPMRNPMKGHVFSSIWAFAPV